MSPLVVEEILSIRDQPPEGLRRVPGSEAIHYYLQRSSLLQLFQLPVPSPKTIYRILKANDRIITPSGKPPHQPQERPAPMTRWQIDFQERPHQGISCGNRPPLVAFPRLAPLPALPATVDPDSWLDSLDGEHLERKVDRSGMVSVDLKRYYVSPQLTGKPSRLMIGCISSVLCRRKCAAPEEDSRDDIITFAS